MLVIGDIMRKIVIAQQILDPRSSGGVSSEFLALEKSDLKKKYIFKPMILYNMHRGINISDILFYYNELKKINPDIVHVRGAAIDGLNAIIAAKIYGSCRILTVVHGMYSDLVYINKIKKIICRYIIEPIIFNLSDGIACVCKTAADRKCFSRYKTKMLPYIYNRMPKFDFDNFEKIRFYTRKKLGIDKNKLVGLFCGRLTKEKGLDILRMSIHRLISDWPQQLCLLFVGDGAYRNELESFCISNNATCVFVGNQNEVVQYYFASDFFVFPSLHENHSIALLEACAAHLPSIVTNCGGNKEIINNDIGIVIPVGDDLLLEKAIRNMLNPAILLSFKDKIKNYDFSRFSDKSCDARLDFVYNKLLCN